MSFTRDWLIPIAGTCYRLAEKCNKLQKRLFTYFCTTICRFLSTFKAVPMTNSSYNQIQHSSCT